MGQVIFPCSMISIGFVRIIKNCEIDNISCISLVVSRKMRNFAVFKHFKEKILCVRLL